MKQNGSLLEQSDGAEILKPGDPGNYKTNNLKKEFFGKAYKCNDYGCEFIYKGRELICDDIDLWYNKGVLTTCPQEGCNAEVALHHPPTYEYGNYYDFFSMYH